MKGIRIIFALMFLLGIFFLLNSAPHMSARQAVDKGFAKDTTAMLVSELQESLMPASASLMLVLSLFGYVIALRFERRYRRLQNNVSELNSTA
jgi:ABC-type multidrug transport system fused ATPase/permease subunit